MSEPHQTWPDCYYYAATRFDVQLMKDQPANRGMVVRTLRASAIVVDTPISVVVDTAVLPFLLYSDTGRALIYGESMFDCQVPRRGAPHGNGAPPSGDQVTPTPAPRPLEKLEATPLEGE